MSQRDLARSTGISPSYINDLIRGRRRPTGRVRKIIATTLRVPVSMLIPHNESAA